MKKLFLIAAMFVCLLGTTAQAQTFTLDPTQWVIDPQQPDFGEVMPFTKNGALAFWFPNNTSPNFTGYLLLNWTQPLTGSTFTAQIQISTFPGGSLPVRFVAPDNGGCTSPAKVYIFFQTGALYNGIEGTQWWASVDAWQLADTGTGTITITADLTDPSKWYSVFGHPATQFPAEFANAKLHPTEVGFTYGGNCANGHGVATRKGDARWRLTSFVLQ